MSSYSLSSNSKFAKINSVLKLLYRFTKRWIKRFLLVFILLALILAITVTVIVYTSTDEDFKFEFNDHLVNDITGLNPIVVSKIIKPSSTEDVVLAIKSSEGPVSIGGGKFSQGGQTAYYDSIHFDMRTMNKVLNFNKDNKTVTVGTGMTWRQIQEHIDPHNLSIKIMQTYADFTVGGSLSVNVHGRYIGHGPIISSVDSFKMVLADGQVIEASRDNNQELFYGAIGGYGGLGIITEATLNLADNTKIERITKKMPIEDYPAHFKSKIRTNSKVIMHNADIYPPDYEKVLDVSWFTTEKPLTNETRVIPKGEDYYWGPKAAEFVANYDIGKKMREHLIDPLYYSENRVVWRNWEASYDVNELEPQSRDQDTYVLREYFVPVDKLLEFVPKMKEIFNRHEVNVLNVSIRHVFADTESILSWAPTESYAFVVYYRQGVDPISRDKVKVWSNEIVDAVLSVGGSYYLPYQNYASFDQFAKAYPNYQTYFDLKKRLDPNYRFRNELWKKYYLPGQNIIAQKKLSIDNYYRGTEQTFLTIPEWYLVFNPEEYAQFLADGNNPSSFPFIESVKHYWTLYDRVREICDKRYPRNSEYITMLRVIGISTTVEYVMKSAYENTIGRLTRLLVLGKDTQEDKLIADANMAYSKLILDEPWYEFPFSEWIGKIWSDTDFWGFKIIRKLERKLFFTLEYGFKSLYAKMIKSAVQANYEPSEGLVYMTVKRQQTSEAWPEDVEVQAQSGQHYLISMPRWGKFSKIIPELANNGVEFEDISGNHMITFSYVIQNDKDISFKHARRLFSDPFVSDNLMRRDLMLVDITHLTETINDAQQQGIKVEHIFDY